MIIRRLYRRFRPPSSFGGQVVLTTGTNLLIAVLGLATGSLAARLLGPEGRGQLAAIQMWPVLFAAVAHLGIPHALTFYAARTPQIAGRYFGSALTLTLLAALPFFAIGYIVLPYVLSDQNSELIASARWYLLLVFLQPLVSMPHHLLRGESRFVAWNILRTMPGVAWLGVLLAGWLWGQADPVFYAAAFLGVFACLMLPTYAVLRKHQIGSYRPDPQLWRPMLSYGLPSVLTTMPHLLNLRLDQMLMVAFLPIETFGLYVVAVTWSGAVAHLPNALAVVLLPRTASQYTEAQRGAVFAQGIRLAVLSAFSVAIGVAVLTPWALPLLFGERFDASIPAALILVAAAAVSSINTVLEEGVRGLGRPVVAFYAEVVGLAVTIITLALFLPRFGIIGAALASLFGYSAVAVALGVSSLRLTGYRATNLFCPQVRDIQRILQRVQFGVSNVSARQAG